MTVSTMDIRSLKVGDSLPSYTLRAHNAATESSNKIHEDSVARQYGFRGGLVPGVTVHAYMTRPLAEGLGADWVGRGTINSRFIQPLYEGDECTVSATVVSVTPELVSFELAARNQAGEACGIGSATLPAVVPAVPAAAAVAVAPLPGRVPVASPESLAVGTVLGSLEERFEPGGRYADFLAEVNDDLAIYRGEGLIAHPGYLIRSANTVLVENVMLGPWIHVSSDVQHFSFARPGDHLRTAAVVTDHFEKKGHKFVDLDVLVVANGTRPVYRALHRAIYEVRTASPA